MCADDVERALQSFLTEQDAVDVPTEKGPLRRLCGRTCAVQAHETFEYDGKDDLAKWWEKDANNAGKTVPSNTVRRCEPHDDALKLGAEVTGRSGLSEEDVKRSEPRDMGSDLDYEDNGGANEELERPMRLGSNGAGCLREMVRGRLVVRGSVWPVDCAIWDNSARRDLSVRVDRRTTTDDDRIQTEAAISLDAETTNESVVDTTSVMEGEEIILAELGLGVNTHTLADLSAHHAEVQSFEVRVKSKDTASRASQKLVRDPPA